MELIAGSGNTEDAADNAAYADFLKGSRKPGALPVPKENRTNLAKNDDGITLQTLIVTAVLVLVAAVAATTLLAINQGQTSELESAGRSGNDAPCAPWEMLDQDWKAKGLGGGVGNINTSAKGCRYPECLEDIMPRWTANELDYATHKADAESRNLYPDLQRFKFVTASEWTDITEAFRAPAPTDAQLTAWLAAANPDPENWDGDAADIRITPTGDCVLLDEGGEEIRRIAS